MTYEYGGKLIFGRPLRSFWFSLSTALHLLNSIHALVSVQYRSTVSLPGSVVIGCLDSSLISDLFTYGNFSIEVQILCLRDRRRITTRCSRVSKRQLHFDVDGLNQQKIRCSYLKHINPTFVKYVQKKFDVFDCRFSFGCISTKQNRI